MAKQNILTRSKKLKAAECFRKGQWQEADALYQSVCQLDPGDAGSWVMRAELNRELGLFAKAESYCQRALVLNPGFSLAHQELGNIHMAQGKPHDATLAYTKAIQFQPDLPEAHYNLANALREVGHPDEAAKHYRVAVQLRPNFIQALNNLGAVLTGMGGNAEAANVLGRAHALFPESPEILSNIGDLLKQDKRRQEAIEKYEHALRLDPGHIEAISGLADVLEQTNRFDEARLIVDRGLALGSDHPMLQIVAARLDRRDGRYAEAAKRLEVMLERQPGMAQQSAAYMLLGQLYDRLDKPEMAFSAFTKGNALTSEFEEKASRNLPSYLDHVRRMGQYLDVDFGSRPLSPPVEADVPAPIFLMGFMRSGTTLLEQVLDGHPSLQALEEKPTVDAMVKAFEEMAQDRENALADLSEDEIAKLRQVYFDEVARHVDIRPGAILVDKMPLNTANAHVIWRVFPAAKFILAIRHPCDVCLSCFMQNFRINESTTNFLDLEESAHTYAAVMSVWRLAQQTLPIQYHRIRYEDLVANFEQELRRLFEYLGMEWRDEVLGFSERALKRGNVQTASYHQVTQPIYQHAKYRWKRYATQLAPIMSILEPFIDYFDYSEKNQ